MSVSRAAWRHMIRAARWVIVAALPAACEPSRPPKIYEASDGHRLALLFTKDTATIDAGVACDAGDAPSCVSVARELERVGEGQGAITLYRHACERGVAVACDDWRRVERLGPSPQAPRTLSAETPRVDTSVRLPSVSGAPPKPVAPMGAEAQLALLLEKRSWTTDERIALVKHLGFPDAQTAHMVESLRRQDAVKVVVERADVDERTGDELVVFYDGSGVLPTATLRVAVARIVEARAVVFYRSEIEWMPFSDVGFATRSVKLVASPTGKKHFVVQSADGALGFPATERWRVFSLREGVETVHLEGADGLKASGPDGMSAIDVTPGGGIARTGMTGVVETWTWNEKGQRYEGKGPNGRWFDTRPAKGKRPGRSSLW